MMHNALRFLIILPILVGILRGVPQSSYKYSYLLLLTTLILGFITELAWLLIPVYIKGNIVANCYLLTEFVLIGLQLYQWAKDGLKKWHIILYFLVILFWFIDVGLIESISMRIGWFRIVYSYALLLGLYEVLNGVILGKGIRSNVFQFIVSVTLLVFYSYNILVELFCLNYLYFSKSFILNVFMIKSVINALSMISLSIAILCIPKKPRFITSFG